VDLEVSEEGTVIGCFRFKVARNDPTMAYLYLPNYPRSPTRVSRSIRLIDVLKEFKGPDVVLDFDEDGVLIGIEVLA